MASPDLQVRRLSLLLLFLRCLLLLYGNEYAPRQQTTTQNSTASLG
jgi:hypothetical protein